MFVVLVCVESYVSVASSDPVPTWPPPPPLNNGVNHNKSHMTGELVGFVSLQDCRVCSFSN